MVFTSFARAVCVMVDASSIGKRRQAGFDENDDASPIFFGKSDTNRHTFRNEGNNTSHDVVEHSDIVHETVVIDT